MGHFMRNYETFHVTIDDTNILADFQGICWNEWHFKMTKRQSDQPPSARAKNATNKA